GIVGTLVAVLAALVTWRAPEIVDTLLTRPGSSAAERAQLRGRLRGALVSLIILDVLLLTLDPTLASVFGRIRANTTVNFAQADIVLTAFQTVSAWMFAITALAVVGTVAVVARLLEKS